MSAHEGIIPFPGKDKSKGADPAKEPQLSHLDYEFMPAALEVLNKPPTPFSRAMLLFIVVASVIALSWAIIGKMDVVVTAPGKVVPTGKVKVIQPLETSIVRNIFVYEGQEVRAGQKLIELDSTENKADKRALEKELLTAKLEVARLLAQVNEEESFTPPAEADELSIASANMILESALQEHRQRMVTLDSEIAKAEAEIKTVAANVAQLNKSVKLSRELFNKKKKLEKVGIITHAELLQAEIDMITARKELQAERNRQAEALVVMNKSKEQKQLAEAEYRHQLLDQLSEAQTKRDNLDEQLVKITNRQSNAVLKAPVDGTVQQLAVNTIGGVVTAAQPLMVLVPANSGLEIQANVLNKDIGYINTGQTVSVKVDTFSFTRHGDLPGELEWVGQDSVADQTLGPVYPVRVSLGSYELPKVVDGRQGKVSPGMTVMADIKIGRRRVVEYFLGPIMRYRDQALRER